MKIISIEFNYCKVIQTNRMGFEETDIAGFIVLLEQGWFVGTQELSGDGDNTCKAGGETE